MAGFWADFVGILLLMPAIKTSRQLKNCPKRWGVEIAVCSSVLGFVEGDAFLSKGL